MKPPIYGQWRLRPHQSACKTKTKESINAQWVGGHPSLASGKTAQTYFFSFPLFWHILSPFLERFSSLKRPCKALSIRNIRLIRTSGVYALWKWERVCVFIPTFFPLLPTNTIPLCTNPFPLIFPLKNQSEPERNVTKLSTTASLGLFVLYFSCSFHGCSTIRMSTS